MGGQHAKAASILAELRAVTHAKNTTSVDFIQCGDASRKNWTGRAERTPPN